VFGLAKVLKNNTQPRNKGAHFSR